MQMRVDSHHPVEGFGNKVRHLPRRHSLALIEAPILPHIGQIWRDQPDLGGTEFSRSRGSKDKRQEFPVWIRESADDGDEPSLGAGGKPQVSFSVWELSRVQTAQLVVEVVGKLTR